MAHILAQKQLRSIILSVSLATSSSSHLHCILIFLFLSVFVCLYIFSGLCLYCSVISERRWHLLLLPLSHLPGYYLLYSFSCTCSLSLFHPVPCVKSHFSLSCSLIWLLLSNPRHSLPNPLILLLLPLVVFLQNPCLTWPQNLSSLLPFSLHI